MGKNKRQQLDKIADTIRALATTGMAPKALIDAVRERHPEASKKQIARAAFLVVILSAEFSSEDSQTFHDLASADEPDDSA